MVATESIELAECSHGISFLSAVGKESRLRKELIRLKKLSNRLKATMVMCGIVFVLMVGGVGVASAQDYGGNWGNTSYSSVAYATSVSYTDPREKLNYTSSWDECYSGASHTVEVAATGWVWDVQFVGSPLYWFTPGSSGYLINYVKENTYPRALLWFNNHHNYATTLVGAWSPDSI